MTTISFKIEMKDTTMKDFLEKIGAYLNLDKDNVKVSMIKIPKRSIPEFHLPVFRTLDKIGRHKVNTYENPKSFLIQKI